MKLKTIRNFFIIAALVVVSFGIGYQLGVKEVGGRGEILQSIIERSTNQKKEVNLSLFWDVWDRLNRYYIDKKALDPQKMIYGAISGMVASLGDPYTVFLPPEQNKEAKDDLSGKFEGIGAQLGVKEKKIVVIAPLKDSPAEKAGIRAGDWITKVEGKETVNWTLYEAVSKIRGPKGSTVTLTILHKDAASPAEIKVTRETINVVAVSWDLKNVKCSNNTILQCKIIKEDCNDCQKIAYLKLDRFGDQTSSEWNKAVDGIFQAMKQSAPEGLVFDLRNNPGGYLTGSVFIASEFLKNGPVVIQESATGGRQTYEVNRPGRLLEIPMVVLINKGSASASEIVAGVLKERQRAKIVGETSFGKGSIQEAQDLPEGAGIHITTYKWLLPSGKWINSSGVEPDIKVENNDAKPEEDLQLEKAIEILVK